MPIDSNAPLPLLHPHERSAFDFAFAAGNIQTVLDIGCGTGRTTGILADEYAMTVTAFDIDPKAIEVARSRYPNLNFSVFDAQDMSRFPDNSFDAAIFSANGIGMIPTQEGRHKCLTEISRVLRDRGVLIYSRHSFHGLFRRRVAKLLLWRNLEGLLRGTSYLNYVDKLGNTLSVSHSTPSRERKDLADAGLKLVAKFQREMFDHWPYYVAQKSSLN